MKLTNVERQEDGQKILQELIEIQQSLQQSNLPQLAESFGAVINPLLREFKRIEKKLQEKPDAVDTESLNQKFDDWAKRSKFWLQLSRVPEGEEQLMEQIAETLIQTTHTKVDRDIQTLNSYKYHEVKDLAVNPNTKKLLMKRLNDHIVPHIESLRILAHSRPEDLSLESIAIWKASLDEERQRHFDTVFALIGNEVESVKGGPFIKNPVKKDKKLFQKVQELEHEVLFLCRQVKTWQVGDLKDQKILKENLHDLETQWHLINNKIDLSPDLHQRVDTIYKGLVEIKVLLFQ